MKQACVINVKLAQRACVPLALWERARREGVVILLAAMSLSAWAGGDGSDGHTHAAPEALALPKISTPRTSATSEEFEAVAVLEDGKLLLYLDRFASNEPVVNAKVEIEGGGLNGVAAELSPGVYVMDVTSISPSKHPLTITVEAGDSADLLSIMLDAAMPQAMAAPVRSWKDSAIWLGMAALLLVIGILLLVRRFGKARSAK
ncbi:MAG: hypothetical protein Q8O37_02395 [Sulfuricellaceae bacterium]|nr:hypothetical protein [Sulfuricellaceae bacterium]